MSGISEQDANVIAPRLISSMVTMQEDVLGKLHHCVDAGKVTVADIPGYFSLSDTPDTSSGFFIRARIPPVGESPPLAGILHYVEHTVDAVGMGTLSGVSGKLCVLRHAIQRWVMRGGGSSFIDMCEDIQLSMPFVGLLLSTWVEGSFILPSPKGIYLGELCRSKEQGQVRTWIELWTFTDERQMFRTPKSIRDRFYQEVFLNEEEWNVGRLVSEAVLSGRPMTPELLFSAIPLMERVRNIMDSDLWRRHMESRKRRVA